MKAKVLIICPFTAPNQGGVESHIQKLLTYIGKKDYQSIVVTYQPLTTPVKAKSYEKFSDYEMYRMSWFGNGWFPKIEHNPLLTFLYLVPGLLFLSLVVGFKRNKEIGVIHAHGLAATFIGGIINFFLRKRLVVSTHAIYNLQKRLFLAKLIKLVLKPAHFILAVGEPSRQEIINLDFPPSQVAVHPNWVDTEFFRPEERKSRRTVLFVGRGLEKKGIFIFGELAKLNPSLKFVARVGDGPDLARFQTELGKLPNLEIRTTLPIDFAKKMTILKNEYQASDIFLMPSLYPEGFAAVVLEAASSGLAIISSNLGCLPDMLTGSGAILISPTLEIFQNALTRLLNDGKKLQECRVQMRRFALKHFSEKNAEVIWKSYQF